MNEWVILTFTPTFPLFIRLMFSVQCWRTGIRKLAVKWWKCVQINALHSFIHSFNQPFNPFCHWLTKGKIRPARGHIVHVEVVVPSWEHSDLGWYDQVVVLWGYYDLPGDSSVDMSKSSHYEDILVCSEKIMTCASDCVKRTIRQLRGKRI